MNLKKGRTLKRNLPSLKIKKEENTGKLEGASAPSKEQFPLPWGRGIKGDEAPATQKGQDTQTKNNQFRGKRGWSTLDFTNGSRV